MKPNGKSRIKRVAPWWAGLCLVFAAVNAAAGDELSFPELPATITLPHIAARPGPLAREPENVLTGIPHFDARSPNFFQIDLRRCDLTKSDLEQEEGDLARSQFDDYTRWPPRAQMPARFDPAAVMESSKNPGLGVRALHRRGITGRGVGIGIVDQRMLTTHQEYAGQLDWYEELGPPGPSAMHGPAVASLAVGRTIGAAPEARLFYIAIVVSGRRQDMEATYRFNGKAIRRLLEINERLPAGEKIHVISISLGIMPGVAGGEEFREAIEEARGRGVAVFVVEDDSTLPTKGHLFIEGLARPGLGDPDAILSFQPEPFLLEAGARGGTIEFHDRVFVPMDSRTLAGPTGESDYWYSGQGGSSWTVPYVAGLYALAAQVKPTITPAEFNSVLLRTGRSIECQAGDKRMAFGPIVDPAALIRAIE